MANNLQLTVLCPTLSFPLYLGLKIFIGPSNNDWSIGTHMLSNLGTLLGFSCSLQSFSLYIIRPFRDVKELGATCVDEDPTLIILRGGEPYCSSNE